MESQFQTLFQTMGLGVLIQDASEKVLYANPAAARILGLPLEELLTQKNPIFSAIRENGDTFLHDEHPSQICIHTGKPVKNVIMGIRPDRSSDCNWLLVNSTPEFFQNQTKPYRVITTFADISDIKLYEGRIKEQQQYSSSILDAIPDLVAILDLNGSILELRSGNQEKLIIPRDDIAGSNIYRLFTPELATRIQEAIASITQGIKPAPIEYQVNLDGKILYYEARFNALTDQKVIALVSNITDRKLSTIKIQQSEEKYRSLFYDSPEPYFLVQDGTYIDCNNAAEKLTGYTREKLYNKTPADISPQYQPNGHESDEYSRELIQEALESKNDFFEWTHIRPDGSEFLTQIRLSITEHQERPAILATMHDITAQRQAEVLIRKLSQSVEQSPVGILITTTKKIIEYVNPTICDITGYLKEELLGKNISIFNNSETTDTKNDQIWNGIQEGKTWKGEYQTNRKNGEPYWEFSTIAPIFDDNENISNYILVKEDITERVSMQESLELNQSRFFQATEHTRTVIWEIDATGLYTYLSPVSELVYGYKPEELVHKKYFFDLHPEEDREEYKKKGFELFEQGSPKLQLDNPIQTKQGDIIWVSTNGSRILNDTGKFLGYRGVDYDISSRKLAENEINKLKLAIEQSPVGIVITDLNATVEYVSPGFTGMSGYSNEEIIGKNIRMLKSKITPDSIYQGLWETIKNGNPWYGEWYNKRKNGTLYLAKVAVSPIIDKKGQISNYLTIQEDITLQRRSQQLVEDTKNRALRQQAAITQIVLDESLIASDISHAFERITEIATDALDLSCAGIWFLSEDNQELHCKKYFDSLTKTHTSGQILLRSDIPHYFEALIKDRMIYAEDAQKDPRTRELKQNYLIPEGITSLLDSGIILNGKIHGVLCLEHKGPKRRWFSDEVVFAGTFVSLISQLISNLNRQKAEENLRKSEVQFKKLYLESPSAIIIFHKNDGSILDANPTAYTLYGVTSLEELQSYYSSFIAMNPSYSLYPWILETILRGPQQIEWQSVRANGEVFWENINLNTIEMNNEIQIISSSIDISKQKQAEKDRIAREAAESANKSKSAFLSNMSHEIRTPLNAIIGFSQVLRRDKNLSPKQIEQIQTIYRSGEHLLQLINDILDLSKIEAGQLTVQPNSFNFDSMYLNLSSLFSLSAKKKGLLLLFEKHQFIPRNILGDEAKIRQVLINLIGNSIKFTSTGRVTVRVKTDLSEARDHGDFRLYFEVEDTGPGIPEKDLGSIFKSFQQSESGRLEGGTGLGLSISSNLVSLMGGSLEVISTVGIGTKFTFFLPVKIAQDSEDEKKTVPNKIILGLKGTTKDKRVLIVDDNKDNRSLLVSILEPVGFEIHEARDGMEAVNTWKKWKPHIILMDLQLPRMDGFKACKIIRESDEGKSTVIIAVTASAFEDDKQSVLEAGMDGYVRKPFNPETLFHEMQKSTSIEYIYSDEPVSGMLDSLDISRPVTGTDIVQLPNDLVRSMEQAVTQGNMVLLREQIDQIQPKHQNTARGLLLLAKNYEYDTLMELFREKKEKENGK